MAATRPATTSRRRRTCVFALHVHLVFVTKYRRKVFTSEHLTLLAEVFADVCADFGAVLTECNGEDDHVHLLIEYPPTVQLSKLVNSPERRLLAQVAAAIPGTHPPRPPMVAVVLRRVV